MTRGKFTMALKPERPTKRLKMTTKKWEKRHENEGEQRRTFLSSKSLETDQKGTRTNM